MSAKAYDKFTAAFAGFVIQNIPADLDENTMQGWMDNPTALKKLLAGLAPPESARAEPASPFTAPDIFRLTVDYGQSLEQMIAAGRYDWVNGDITPKRFPIRGEGLAEFEARHFHFDRDISSENAIKEIEQADTANPWSPAKIEHLLAYGAAFPEVQRKFPIIGLGSVAKVGGNRYVSYLYGHDSLRRLNLRWFGLDWGPVSRFLAVRKVSAA